MTKLHDLTGQIFGAWYVQERAENDHRGCSHWLCRCSCGTERVVAGGSLRNGHSTNCGCANRIDPNRTEKKCARCQETKAIGSYGTLTHAKDGHCHYCKPCMNLWSVESRRRVKYGLTPEEYQDMAEAQGGRCASCRYEIRLVVDHSHDTGKVRGLLCNSCNTALGFLQDDPRRIDGLLKYLQTHLS